MEFSSLPIAFSWQVFNDQAVSYMEVEVVDGKKVIRVIGRPGGCVAGEIICPFWKQSSPCGNPCGSNGHDMKHDVVFILPGQLPEYLTWLLTK